uniref:Tumor protein p53-inducible protein 11 n=1 Tax=Branchiostoma floridae TaxID=7739 RepID=C3Z0M9_BRAFL|eukprot:XP_002597897.1 hypothetical protein BRAFLDRAFT_97884 [Branchiostoma floridae]
MTTSYPAERTRKKANMCAAKTPDKEGSLDQTTPSTTPSSSSPPLLLRKESCGDLQSRLKTRKMLGVGEDDDGEIHRSKISQILGRSEHLKTRLPPGLRTWQVLSAATITALALTMLVFPDTATQTVLSTSVADVRTGSCSSLNGRLHGTALAAVALLLWSAATAPEKLLIRWGLLMEASFLLFQAVATEMSVWGESERPGLSWAPVVQIARLLGAMTSMVFYRLTGAPPRKPGTIRDNQD